MSFFEKIVKTIINMILHIIHSPPSLDDLIEIAVVVSVVVILFVVYYVLAKSPKADNILKMLNDTYDGDEDFHHESSMFNSDRKAVPWEQIPWGRNPWDKNG